MILVSFCFFGHLNKTRKKQNRQKFDEKMLNNARKVEFFSIKLDFTKQKNFIWVISKTECILSNKYSIKQQLLLQQHNIKYLQQFLQHHSHHQQQTKAATTTTKIINITIYIHS